MTHELHYVSSQTRNVCSSNVLPLNWPAVERVRQYGHLPVGRCERGGLDSSLSRCPLMVVDTIGVWESRVKLPQDRPKCASSMGRVEELELAWTLESMSLYHSLPLDLRFCISSAIIRVPETMSLCSLSWILDSNFSISSSTPLMNGISSTYSIITDVLGHPRAKKNGIDSQVLEIPCPLLI